MSMLAERKRKQKWSLNPRGKEWSSDSNKFGQKLLEKMGWSAGKGLGAKEDGLTEPVKVLYKNDSKGMGYKESDNQWTEHESNFSNLLSSLSDSTADPGVQDDFKTVESLEKKSRNSRARVHYSKFTRGKDLSRYSEKDLANIFGRKELKTKVKDPETQQTNDYVKKFGVETHNGGCMKDYFKNKMPNFKRIARSSESDDGRPSFGFGFKQPCTVVRNENNNEEPKNKEKRKRSPKPESDFGSLKKKSKKFDSLNTLEDDADFACTLDKKREKKSKNSHQDYVFEISSSSSSEDSLFVPSLETIPEEDEVLEVPVEQGNLKMGVDKRIDKTDAVEKSKKKSKKSEKPSGIINLCFEDSIDGAPTTSKRSRDENGQVGVSKKPKKSKKSKIPSTTINLCSDDSIDEVPATSKRSSDENGQVEVSKKPKKSKKSEKPSGIINLCFDDSNDGVPTTSKRSSDENGQLEVSKKPKKSKKSKIATEGLVNSCFEDSIVEAVPGTSKQSNYQLEDSIKSKRCKGVENSAFNDDDDEPCAVDTRDGFEVKRGSKKRKYDDAGISNPCFEDNYPEEGRKKKRKKTRWDPDPRLVENSKEPQDANASVALPTEDIRLNVVSTPILNVPGESFRNPYKIDRRGKQVDKNVHSLSKRLDDCQAAIENDINQAKETYIGEDVLSDGEDSILPNGEVKLKLKNAKFGKMPKWMMKNRDPNNPRSSYRHLIKGDIILGFQNTNLHKIAGYDYRNNQKPPSANFHYKRNQ